MTAPPLPGVLTGSQSWPPKGSRMRLAEKPSATNYVVRKSKSCPETTKGWRELCRTVIDPRSFRHIACYAVVGTRRMSVEHFEALSAAWRVTLLAISLLAVAHLLGSIGNSGIDDSEALGKMLLGLVNGGGA
jgi:hypothetical protein